MGLRTTVANSEKAEAGDLGTPLPNWVTAGMLLILSDAIARVANRKWVWFIRTSGWLHTSEGVTSSYSLRCDRVELWLTDSVQFSPPCAQLCLLHRADHPE